MKFTDGICRALALTGIIAFSLSVNAKTYQKSLNIWQSYYPDMDCSKNHCARSVPPRPLEALLEKGSYHYPSKLTNATWMMVSDFTQHSKEKRGYLINTKTGKVTTYHVSHGVGSGDGRGKAIKFSNISNSKMSSKGLYVTAETYYGKHGYSLRMDGKEATNSKARPRAIVIHGAAYMSKNFIKANNRAGRSWGCPAVDNKLSKALIDKLKGGSLYYIYAR
ncbi:MAG: hypothetical protein CME70_14845 [Halobacteriovorax sp.]|nr:hypothetical protein [Halobacteriovorax sp.]|tara:strand:- start:163664 stop:164326 length:663 start_codon:yes stop_codon:yes gene_type:complete